MITVFVNFQGESDIMKVKKKLSPLLIFLIILSALLLVIAFFILSKEKVDLKPDSDTSYYNSYEYGCNSMRIYNGKRFPMSDDYMVYKDGNLYVKDPMYFRADIYYSDRKENVSTSITSQRIENIEVYCDDGSLYMENHATQEKQKLDEQSQILFFDGDRVLYSVDKKKLVIVDAKNINDRKEIDYIGEIFYISINSNTLNVITKNEYKYEIFQYDVDTYLQKSHFEHSTLSNLDEPAIINDYFLYCCKDLINTSEECTFLKYNLKTGEISRAALHNYVQSVTYNNNKIYFSAEKSEWNIVRTTVEDENNGLWEVDIETGTKKKLSDECVFDDLLATEKTIYCHEEWITLGIRDIF